MQFRGHSKDTLATLLLTRFTELKALEVGEGFLALLSVSPTHFKTGCEPTTGTQPCPFRRPKPGFRACSLLHRS